jgi:uncharacterized protein (DUF1778 family)
MKTISTAEKRSMHGGNRLEARVTPGLKRLFQHAADLQGVTLSDFLIQSLRQAAVQTVEEHEMLRLSARDSRRFAKALLAPSKPNARLRAAARRYRRIVAASM